ncbi:TetR/AcrR family transcriptional regulator [Chryseolinea lacunae]|uniref:TetR/AcrR family transcriptional regulator n=1 Tax=Chryseolinea lacunae TaxID=2801331 RepID=A0ABS1L1C6_9BACT|nr:TetR family transcriptional regulator [Chryseolinea lacunae]MBL0745317.1 TetR/AcrR family transcriptional regulator [Chryseolinea lacunae]
MAKKKTIEADLSTQEKIKEAARKVFTQKGYAATRTRDIAEEAGINLALLNYYFRSKEGLFEIVMVEKLQQLFGTIVPILNDEGTTLEKKLELVVLCYIDMLTAHPDLPIFVLSEIRVDPERFSQRIQAGKLLREAYFLKQLKERRPDLHPLHFVMNLVGMTLFPFVGKPIFQAIGNLPAKDYAVLMEERKALIPKWVQAILKTK